LSGFNPVSAETGVAVPSIVRFVSGFCAEEHMGCSDCVISELCDKCVIDIEKRLKYHTDVLYLGIREETCSF